jgi:hypothetical protein
VTMHVALLVGAGASHGAEGIGPQQPPLGRQLLERLEAAFPETWRALLTDDERELFEGDPPFERGMKQIWATDDRGRAQRLLIDMALYFSRFRLTGGRSWYFDLLRELADAEAMVEACSLNYECVFEEAVEKCGTTLTHVGSAGTPPETPRWIIKPHGSCNYLSPMTRRMFNSTIAGTNVYVDSDEPTAVEVVAPSEVEGIYAQQGASIPPAMSLYEPSKHSPVSPKTFDLIRRTWGEMTSVVDAVLTIGARPVLEDEHIWRPIIDADCPVWLVGGGETALRAQIGRRLDVIAPTLELAIPGIRARLQSGQQTQARAVA